MFNYERIILYLGEKIDIDLFIEYKKFCEIIYFFSRCFSRDRKFYAEFRGLRESRSRKENLV